MKSKRLGRFQCRLLGALLFAGSMLLADAPLRIDEADAKKAATEKPAPPYPMTARQLKIAGQVQLDVTISEAGAVDDVKILSGNPLLTKPTSDAIKKWRFTPFEAEGKPTRAIVKLSFEFGSK